MEYIWLGVVLFGTGFAAGLIDTIAGGGGLITLPVLLALGIDPREALGTNKLQASFGSGSATWHYAKAGSVDLSDCKTGVIFTLIGACIGAFAVQQLDPGVLKQLIPALLIGIALCMLFRPKLGFETTKPRMQWFAFYGVFGLALGFYDGFFGPGTGTFWTMAFVFFLGFNMIIATGYTKAMNFTSNIFSLAVFTLGGHVNYAIGLVMAVGQVLGARIGARLAIKKGVSFIRPVFLVVALAIAAKLLHDSYSAP